MFAPEDAADAVFATTEQAGGARFPKTHTEKNYSARISISSPEGTSVWGLPTVTATFPIVQTLPAGEVLVVATRCQRQQDGKHDLNARVYRRDGSLSAEFCLGDGIEHVQTDDAGNIWAGYFDEGVFGNFGWGSAEGAQPIGRAGLVRFDRHGHKSWEYRPPESLDSICDCYALNVTSQGVWACYYTDFPLVRISAEGTVEWWETSLSGVTQIAISGSNLLAFGGYSDNRTDCQLLRLTPGLAETVADVRLCFDNDVHIENCTVIGRDSLLHVFTGADWYSFAVPRS
jgi:hypothetical protein